MRRWWGVRHLRYVWLWWRLEAWYAHWARHGHVGPGVNDAAILDAIWRGEV